MQKLTPRQQRFVEEYLADLNATQAAIRAGYATSGASVEGTRLLANARIATAVAKRQAERSRQTGISAERVLQEIARLAFADMGDFARWGPGGVTFLASDQVDTKAVREVTETLTVTPAGSEIRRISLKLHDKRAALVDLAKHLGLITERIQIDVVSVVRAIAVERGLSDADAERAVEEAQRHLGELQRAGR